MTELRRPCRAVGGFLRNDDRLDTARDGGWVPSQDVLLHAGFQESNARTPERIALLRFPSVEVDQRIIDSLRRAVKIADPGLLSDTREHMIDKLIQAGSPFAPCDHVERDADGLFQLDDRLIEVERLVRCQTLGEPDDSLPFKTGLLSPFGFSARIENRDQPGHDFIRKFSATTQQLAQAG